MREPPKKRISATIPAGLHDRLQELRGREVAPGLTLNLNVSLAVEGALREMVDKAERALTGPLQASNPDPVVEVLR